MTNSLTKGCAVLSLLAVLALAAPSSASAQEASVEGTWHFVLNHPEGSDEWTVEIAQDGEELSWPEAEDGSASAMEGTVEDGKVSLFYTVQADQGFALEVTMDGTLGPEGNSMSGTADFSGMAQGDWTANRVE